MTHTISSFMRSPIFVFAAILLIDLGIMQPWLGPHAPLSDDISMIAFSRDWSFSWFSKGLADYFIVFPEYYGPQSNFIRPVSNFFYWIFSFAIRADAPFLANKAQLIVLNFGTHASICASLYAITRSANSSRLMLSAVLLTAVLMPPFWTTPAPTYSSFVFDELSILFCLIAFIACQNARPVMMTSFLILALLTKEIALPVVGGFLIYFMIKQQWRSAFGPLVSLMIWGVLRLCAFGLHAEGLYVFESSTFTASELFKEKILNILGLPLGPVFFEKLSSAGPFNISDRNGILLLFNIVIYICLSIFLVSALRRIPAKMSASMTARCSTAHAPDFAQLAALVTAFSFAFDGYIGANYRYALNLVPFLCITIVSMRRHLELRRLILVLMAAGSVFASTPSLVRLFYGSEFETYRYKVMRKLFSALGSHTESKTIIILNDFVSGYANPKALEILVPTPTKLIRGTSLYLDSCTVSEIRIIETVIWHDGWSASLTATIPDCARFTFESSPKLQNFIDGNRVNRNEMIYYEFPHETGTNGGSLKAITKRADLLYFDFQSSEWVFVKSMAD